jgi:Phage phiEco32-like COOH.NH2 ligase-type 2
MELDIKQIDRHNVYSFGTDPEIFSRDKAGQVIPAYTFLPSKDRPLVGRQEDSGNEFCVYNDGFQAEMRAKPSACVAYVVDSIQSGLKEVWKKSNGHLVLDNAPMIPVQTLREAPEEHVILGCDPSLNFYHMGGKPCGDPRKLRYRFTGFHVHMSGWYLPKNADRDTLLKPYVQMLDRILGVYFVAAGGHLESAKRREYYGLAGEYRLPPHGLEYRVLSPVAMCHPGIANLAFELTRSVMALVDSNAQDMWVADDDETIGVINANNYRAARALIKRNKVLLQYLAGFNRHGHTDGRGKGVYGIAMNGIDSVVKDPSDFVKNWKFEKKWLNHCGTAEDSGDETLAGLL